MMRSRMVWLDEEKAPSEKSVRGSLRYIVKLIVAIVGLHLSMSVSAYTITVSYPTGGGAAIAPIHEIRKEIVDGVEWTYMTGFLYIEQDSRPKEVMYADWISMNPNGASGVIAVPAYWGVYIGDGTNAAVSASISGHVNVPSELGGMRVIGISANAFWNCSGMTGVTVPDTVLKIQEAAFGRCSGLEEMTLPFIGEERGIDEWAGWTVLGWVFGRTWDVFAGAETTYYDNRWEDREFDGGRFFTMDLAEDRPRITKGSGFCLPAGLKKLTITDETVLARKALCDQPLMEVTLPETLKSMYSGTFENMPLKQVVIPSGIKTIEDSLFSGCTSLTNVVLQSGVTQIGGSAFRNCINLKHIDIPASVTSIGGNAFNHTGLSDIPAMSGMKCIADEMFVDCWEMTKATIPEGIMSIGRSAFLRCPLAEVTIPNTVTNIGHYAFDNQRLISEVEIPSSVKSIGVVAFRECTNLTNVVLSEGLESIGDSVFWGCTALTNITIPESVSKLGINEEGDRLLGCVFRNCTSLERVVLPSMLMELPSGTFYGCKSLVDVALPSNLKRIGDWAFHDCDALVSVDIPQGVTNLGSSVFCRCDGLERVSVPGSVTRIENDTFYLCTNLVNVSLHDGPQSIGRDAFYECKKLERINIPGSVRTIEIDAFKDCSGLSQVTFNEGLEELGWGAFRGCRNVESLVLPSSLKVLGGAAFWGWKEIFNVVIPSNVEVINSQAFEWCTGLKSVEIESGVRSIESNAFGSCTGLESISIPDSVVNIDEAAFSGCDNLKEVHVYDMAAWCNGQNHIKLPHFVYVNGVPVTTLRGFETVSNISNYAFAYCEGITNLTFASSLTNIGGYAFANCSDLETVTIPTNVQSVGRYAFAQCKELTAVIVSTNTTEIYDYAFSSCEKLKAVFVPMGMLGTISSSRNIFRGCPDYLKVIYYDDEPPTFESLSMANVTFNANGGTPASATMTFLADCPLGALPSVSYDNHAFVGWFTEPEGGDEITEATDAYDGQTAYAHWVEPIFTIENGMLMAVDTKGAKEIEIPQGVTSIGEMVFYCGDCFGLEKVVIPCSVTNIGYQAFMYCSDLRQIEIPDSVEHIGAAAFAGCENLESIALPKNLNRIEDSTFYGCRNLSDLLIPAGVTNIDSYAFMECSGLTNIWVSALIEDIGPYAFSRCLALQNVYMPIWMDALVSDTVFEGCSDGLVLNYYQAPRYSIVGRVLTGVELNGSKEIEIPSIVESIGFAAFQNNSDLTSVRIGNNVTNIGRYAFLNCGNLAYVGIDDSVESIEAYAFCNCSNLVTVVLPKALSLLGEKAFAGCTSLTGSLAVPGSLERVGYGVFDECVGLTSLILEDGLKFIDNYAFSGCKNLKKIQMGKTIECIGDYAFSGCRIDQIVLSDVAAWCRCHNGGNFQYPHALHCNGENSCALSIPDGVSRISDYAFYGCTNITTIALGNDIKTIGNYTFFGCNAISGSLVLPQALTIIGARAFGGCINFSGELDLPDGLTNIGDGAFNGCGKLSSLTIPDSIERIGCDAFGGCQFLLSDEKGFVIVDGWLIGCSYVLDPKDLEIIKLDLSAVRGIADMPGMLWIYPNLREVVFSENLKRIGAGFFAGCMALQTISLPDSLESIGEQAFMGCDNLLDGNSYSGFYAVDGWIVDTDWSNQSNQYATSLDLSTARGISEGVAFGMIFPNLRRIILPERQKTICSNMFQGLMYLNSITLPHNVTYIGAHAFEGCGNLTRVILPEGVGYVGDYAFAGCGFSGVFEFPSTIQSIGEFVFAWDVGLNTVYLPSSLEGDVLASTLSDDVNNISILYQDYVSVAFDANGGGCSKNLIIRPVGQSYGELPDAIRDGFLFLGWFTEREGGVRISNSNNVTVECTLYAQWLEYGIPLLTIENNILTAVDMNGGTELLIPYGVTNIAEYVASWLFLEKVSIPDSVESIGYNAFKYCNESLYDKSSYKGLIAVDGWIVGIDDSYSGEDIGFLDISTAKGVANYVSLGWVAGLTGVAFPNNMKSVGNNYDLAYRSNLKEVVLPAQAQSIQAYAFSGCYNLTNVVMSEGLETIGCNAFQGCNRLTELKIPNSLKEIGAQAFQGCDALFDSSSFPGFYMIDGWIVGLDDYYHYYETKESLDLSGVRGIANEVFLYRFCNLRTISLPTNMKMVADSMFAGLHYLEAINIPERVVSIGDYAFSECYNLEQIHLPNGIETIGYSAFRYCTGLTEVVVPNSVTHIGDLAFADCTNLKRVYLPSKFEGSESLSLAFMSCDPELQFVYVDYAPVIFDDNGGGLGRFEISFAIGQTFGAFPAVSRNGYMFVGWFTQLQGGVKITESDIVNKNMILYAHWKKAQGPTSFAGDADWVQESGGSWRSGVISDYGSTSAIMNVNGSGRIVFNWKTSSESGYDKLHFYVNDVEVVSAISGEMGDWAFVEYEVAESGLVVIKWEYTKDGSVSQGEDCGWIKDVVWISDAPIVPLIDGDEGATVEGDADSGYVIKPSEGKKDVVVTIPDGVVADKVTVEVGTDVQTVSANGANVKVVKGGHDITEHLDIPSPIDGVVAVGSAAVKESVVKETLDAAKGAVIDMTPASPTLTTAETKPGLTYTLREGTTLGGMVDGDSKVGDGEKWTPNITVKGGASGFYTIKVEK